MRTIRLLTIVLMVVILHDLGVPAEAQRRRRTRRASPTLRQRASQPATRTTFIVPDGTRVEGDLNQLLSTKQARQGQRFTLRVREPSEYEGATIEGYVSNVKRSGRLTGRSEMTLNFDRIRLRNGPSYRFAGVLESLRTPGGETVRVDSEGSARDDSQTEKTTKRSVIGAGAGALIGAIAGGGKGAAIGAIIGGGAGAGSVYVQGRDDLEMPSGTELVIRASNPNR